MANSKTDLFIYNPVITTTDVNTMMSDVSIAKQAETDTSTILQTSATQEDELVETAELTDDTETKTTEETLEAAEENTTEDTTEETTTEDITEETTETEITTEEQGENTPEGTVSIGTPAEENVDETQDETETKMELTLNDFKKQISTNAEIDELISEFGYDKLFDLFDSDKDGKITLEEIKSLSPNAENVNDITYDEMEQIINDSTEEEQDFENILSKLKEALGLQDAQQVETPVQTYTPTYSGGGGGGGGGGTISTTGGNNDKTDSTGDTTQDTIESCMEQIEEKENEKLTLQTEAEEEIAELEGTFTELLEEAGVSEELIEEYKTENERLEKEIADKDKEIEDQNTIIQDCEATISAKESAISSFESQISKLEDAKNDDNASEIESKIDNVKKAKEAAEDELAEAKTKKSEAEDEIVRLESEKEDLITEQENLKNNLAQSANLNEETLQKIEEIQNAIAKTRTDTEMELDTIDGEIQELKIELAEAQQKEETDKINEENSTSSLPITDEELAAYGFDTEAKREAWSHLVPEMQEAIVDLTDYARENGIEVTYNSKISIFRTFEEQVEIYNSSRPGYAAKPGNSRHESGEAVDITIPGADKNDPNDPSYKLLGKYWQSLGYTWGGTWNHCEPWHFDLRQK